MRNLITAERSDKVKRHGNRIEAMLDDLGIQYGDTHIDDIVAKRNGLIHELSWSGENFVSSGSSERLQYAYDLRRMNHRIIGRMLGMSGPYFGSMFTSIGIMYVQQVA